MVGLVQGLPVGHHANSVPDLDQEVLVGEALAHFLGARPCSISLSPGSHLRIAKFNSQLENRSDSCYHLVRPTFRRFELISSPSQGSRSQPNPWH